MKGGTMALSAKLLWLCSMFVFSSACPGSCHHGSRDAATLCCSFNVSNPVSRGWSYDVQGEVNTESFLLNRNSECHVTDALGNKLNATENCEKQFRSLKDQVYHFKDVLYQIRGENKTITEPLTLQSVVCGSYAEDGHFKGSWKVNLNGSNMFHGDTKKWLHVNPGIKWTEDMLEKIRNLNDFLNKISQGEFRNKFKESTLHCEENLEPTETTINTMDWTQHISVKNFVIAGSLIAAAAIGFGVGGYCCVSRRHLRKRKIDVQSSSPSLLADSLILPKTSSVNEADEFLTASQNSVLLTLDHTDGNP